MRRISLLIIVLLCVFVANFDDFGLIRKEGALKTTKKVQKFLHFFYITPSSL